MTGSADEDHPPERLPAERPGHVNGAAALLILSALISGTIAVNDPAMTQFVYLLLFITIGAALRFCRGGRTARVVATVTAVVFLFFLGPHVLWGLSDPRGPFSEEYAIRAILAIVTAGIGVGLLHSPPSSAYFRSARPRTARR
ncbi:hypothetical protein QQY66_04475 [Streptomyces sp. DG2A-72]|uniref:hypothetical protein n=1 Tax=Streptomyces sp. DG2A-72 TaxID=3051386 RepID=UPI00265BD0AE|nr:hypothetical protein [Streptomyces sp. DG2A-72]MDO0930968.1 hypothetical protein [Streptomyces sp. DG2A-72]